VSVKYFDWQRREDRDVRPSNNDLETIQKRALPAGLPYQTFTASLLHDYATGRLERI
jgi:predicted DNA binding CopG/RHH family protein